jgi:hypothetical protein
LLFGWECGTLVAYDCSGETAIVLTLSLVNAAVETCATTMAVTVSSSSLDSNRMTGGIV